MSDYSTRKKYILNSINFPIYKCYISPDWKEYGLGQVIITRIQPNQKLVIGTFLVDTYCLEVKDAFYNAEILKFEIIDPRD